MSKNIYGIHDFNPEWADLVAGANREAWAVYTHALGFDANDKTGHDYREATQRQITPIARLNAGYGTGGTIPLPQHYSAFAQRCANFVAASIDCRHWVIGNEISMRWDWPENQPISLENYTLCFRLVRRAIKAVQPDAVVIPQAPAPWNVELRYPKNPSGDWVQQLVDMLTLIGRNELEGIALHTYSRGYNVADIPRDFRMGEPYQHRQSGFRSYRDYMAAMPEAFRDLPVFITESNGNSPWNNYQGGWIDAIYREIAGWNKEAGNQQIHALCLFRWAAHDQQWDMSQQAQVRNDFAQVLAQNYTWNEDQIALQASQLKAGWLAVTTSYVNLRKVAGRSAEILRVLDPGQVVQLAAGPVRKDDLTWWQVNDGWVAEAANGFDLLTHYDDTTWGQALRFVFKWEGGQSWDRNDPGNYTGCQVGQGEFKGTKYGISACSYGHLDIPNLALTDAGKIYHEDYWLPIDGDNLPHPLSLYAMDTAVNMGVGVALELLNRSGRDPYVFNQLRRQRYRDIAGKYPAMGRYLEVWLNRVDDSERFSGVTRALGGEKRRNRRRRDGVCG